ncbi:MAG: alpha/beta hydrolase [Acidimicrobiales bacterium]|nr:alpha/beta hydrolase [Acidimicrobiales bacterium]
MIEPDRTPRVTVAADVDLEVREWDGGRRPFVLVHGLASNARLWDGVAIELARSGHRVVAVDQRGHGRSSKPDEGYDLTTVADDLRTLLDTLRLARPVVVGQSWGANVAIEFAARFPGVAAAIGCVDGGTIDLKSQFPDWDDCASALRPPPLAGTPVDDMEQRLRTAHPDWPESGIAGTMACFEVRADGTVAPWLTLARHLLVLRGLWDHRPAERFGAIQDPVLFIPAGGRGSDEWMATKRAALDEAISSLGAGRVEWIDGDHDLHAQHPDQVATLLRTLAPIQDREVV